MVSNEDKIFKTKKDVVEFLLGLIMMVIFGIVVIFCIFPFISAIFDTGAVDKTLTEKFKDNMDEYISLFEEVKLRDTKVYAYGPGNYGSIPDTVKISPKILIIEIGKESICRYSSIDKKLYANNPNEVQTIIFIDWFNARHNATWTDGRKEYISDIDFYIYDLKEDKLIACVQIRNRQYPKEDFLSPLKKMLK